MDAEYPFHTAFLLLITVIVAIRMYNSGYADARSGVKQTTKGEGMFRVLRAVLGIPVAAGFLAYAVWPPLMDWARVGLSDEARWAGVVPMLLGVALLAWVHKHLAGNFTGTVQIRPSGNVVQTGPYSYVRHPMYWAFLCIGVGLLLLTSNWFIGGGFLFIIFIVMFVRLPREEAALLQAYGEEYAEYSRRVGRFFPKFTTY